LAHLPRRNLAEPEKEGKIRRVDRLGVQMAGRSGPEIAACEDQSFFLVGFFFAVGFGLSELMYR
jgi:hypothetical protein